MVLGRLFRRAVMAKQERNLSHRVLVQIKRGLTDDTPLIVWQHEIPLLESVHGEGTVRVIEDPKAVLDEGFFAKRNDVAKRAPSISLGLDDVFDGDVREEYSRLLARYGQHEKVAMPVVEYVYGRLDEGRFEKIVIRATVDELSERQLRDRLRMEEVEYPPAAKKDQLLSLLTSVTA
jgi:hypothetical protein